MVAESQTLWVIVCWQGGSAHSRTILLLNCAFEYYIPPWFFVVFEAGYKVPSFGGQASYESCHFPPDFVFAAGFQLECRDHNPVVKLVKMGLNIDICPAILLRPVMWLVKCPILCETLWCIGNGVFGC